LMAAKNELSKVGAKVAGVVFNMVNRSSSKYYNYYYEDSSSSHHHKRK
jgi:Mrp family chromosome partitioning ATPase